MERKSAKTAHGPVAYTATGDIAGETIVLLPGFQSDQTGWSSQGYLELLSEYRVLNVDPLGHGRSAAPLDEAAYSAQAVVDHVKLVLDHEGVESAHVWGFSRGGLIAGLFSELASERCSSAIIGGAPLGEAVKVTAPLLDAGEPHLARGDWPGYWASYPVPLPAALTKRFEATNDPRANAAAIRAMSRWPIEAPNFGLNPSSVRRFAYFGVGEVFADPLREVLAANDATWFEGPWQGHAETMMDAEGVVAVVRSFLEH